MTNYDELYQDWLVASYQYYILSVPTKYSDYEYDLTANQLLNSWDDVTHPDKGLVDEDSLRCGSAFHIKADGYPQWVLDKCKPEEV